MLNYRVYPVKAISGECTIPGDKSITHRALLLSAIAEGNSTIEGFLTAGDCLSTLNALKGLGVEIEGPLNNQVIVKGVGKNGFKAPKFPLDLGNSGTAMRLLAGILCPQAFDTILTGDSSLTTRPMGRIIEPLSKMGAQIIAEQDHAPLTIKGKKSLSGIIYELPIASAQVKTAILLAGLYAKDKTTVIEQTQSRDHTERMFSNFCYPLQKADKSVCVSSHGKLHATHVVIPGDFSTAAFFIIAATIARTGALLLKNVGINPTRTGLLSILNEMGARIKIINKRLYGDEPVADLYIQPAVLQGIEVSAEMVPSTIDEFPILFIAAAVCKGHMFFRGLNELRFKETDRIEAMLVGLKQLGVQVENYDDNVLIMGQQALHGGRVDSKGDHRVAMAFTIASLVADGEIEITNCDNIATSCPNFTGLSKGIGFRMEEYYV